MTFDLPPIVKLAERLLAEIEAAVRRFPRSYRYTHGSDLRAHAMKVAKLCHRAWRDRSRQTQWTSELVYAIDDLKLTMRLGQQIHAYVSFRQFEALYRLAIDLGRQCGGWLKQQRLKGQNAPASEAPEQRSSILSPRAASYEANP